MSQNAVFFGWKRSIPGREKLSAQHFQEFSQYLAGLQQKGSIDAFEPVLLLPNGGNLNGFFLIRGASDKLEQMMSDMEWQTHVVRAMLHLEEPTIVRGTSGEAVAERMKLWSEYIPAASAR